MLINDSYDKLGHSTMSMELFRSLKPPKSRNAVKPLNASLVSHISAHCTVFNFLNLSLNENECLKERSLGVYPIVNSSSSVL